jgi:ABC-type uncharacterized transport system ATPase subunit
MFNHQIFLGLIRPFKILLLDEVTVSLDVVVRQDLLRYLRRESEQRGATILYATHIFDGLDDWPTHLHYLCNKGHTGWQVSIASNIQLFFVIKKLLYTVSNNAISLRLSRGKLEN